MINDMKLRRFAPSTQEAYVSAVAGLAKYHNQSPDLLDKEKIPEVGALSTGISSASYG